MIQVHETKINVGNLVNTAYGIKPVYGILGQKVYLSGSEYIHIGGVQLIQPTPELLRSAGFVKKGMYYSFSISRFPETELKELIVDITAGMIALRNGEIKEPRHEDDIIVIHNADKDGPVYVHAIQNFVTALTGKELEFK